MKNRKKSNIIVGLILALVLTFTVMTSVQASQKSHTITKTLAYQKSLDISLGNGGFYFPISSYTGKATLERVKPVNTKHLLFSQRWSELTVYDTAGKEVERVYGFIYVYFNLNVEDLKAWNKGDLSIYHYDEAKKIWTVCDTQWIAGGTNAPYGRARCLVTTEFGLYGLAIKR